MVRSTVIAGIGASLSATVTTEAGADVLHELESTRTEELVESTTIEELESRAHREDGRWCRSRRSSSRIHEVVEPKQLGECEEDLGADVRCSSRTCASGNRTIRLITCR